MSYSSHYESVLFSFLNYDRMSSLYVTFYFLLLVENHCVDKEGKKYADGEKWKEGKCGPDCQCSNGVLSCYSSGCSIFLVGEGTQCKIRPGTEEDCCPQYDCEEGKLF